MRYFLNRHSFNGFTRHRLLSFTPELLWVFVGQSGSAIAGLLGVKVLTNLLSPGDYGKLALANTIAVFISTNFLFGPLGEGLMRFWPIAKKRGELGAFHYILNRYSLYVTGLSIVVTVALIVVVMHFKGINWAILLMISMATGTASGWLGLRISAFTAERKRMRIAFLQIGHALLRPVFAAILILLVATQASLALAGYFAAVLVILLVAQRLYNHTVTDISPVTLEKEKSSILYKGLGRDIISFSWPFMVWGIFSWIHFSADRWSLQVFHGKEVVGAFAVVSQLAMFPLIFGSGLLSRFFYPIANQRAGTLATNYDVISAYKILAVMTAAYIAGAIILITLFSIFHNTLVLLVSNIKFVKFSTFLPGLTAAWALFYLGQALSTFGLLANKPQSYIKPKVVTSIIALISTFYLSATLGPVGVVWGLLIAGFVHALWCLIIAAKLVGKSLVGIDVNKKEERISVFSI